MLLPAQLIVIFDIMKLDDQIGYGRYGLTSQQRCGGIKSQADLGRGRFGQIQFAFGIVIIASGGDGRALWTAYATAQGTGSLNKLRVDLALQSSSWERRQTGISGCFFDDEKRSFGEGESQHKMCSNKDTRDTQLTLPISAQNLHLSLVSRQFGSSSTSTADVS